MARSFHFIDWETWPRSGHFNYYYNQIKCRYTLTAHIDIAPLRVFQKERKLKKCQMFYTKSKAMLEF